MKAEEARKIANDVRARREAAEAALGEHLFPEALAEIEQAARAESLGIRFGRRSLTLIAARRLAEMLCEFGYSAYANETVERQTATGLAAYVDVSWER